MKVNDTFPFDLSLDELHWLAGAFGIASLPLPDHPQLDLSRAELVERQKKGHASLLRRGLIQPSPGFGWQVDRLPAAIVQWMATAESMLRVERTEKEHGRRVMHVFTSNDQILSVEITAGVVNFILYNARAVMMKSLRQWLNLPTKIKKTKEVFTIPQPQIFFAAAWQNPDLVEKMLTVAGVRPQVQMEAEWVESIMTVSMLSKIPLHQTEHSSNSYLFLCMDKNTLWTGSGTDLDKQISFEMMTLQELDAKILAMI
jgi:hypothetical protein